MYQTIDEKIVVVGVYDCAVFTPKKFRWKSRVYPIQAITMVSEVKDGGVAKRFYAVASGGNMYRLIFNRDSEVWWLGEVWCE
jgi:hypothetical protein